MMNRTGRQNSKMNLKSLCLFGALSGVLILSFQNCHRVAVNDVTGGINAKAEVPNTVTPEGDVVYPVEQTPRSIYVCPPGTQTASSAPAASPAPSSHKSNLGSLNYASAVSISYGGSASASSNSASTSSGNFVSINQTGGHNYAQVYQQGSNNHSSIVQNGHDNSACVVQVGDTNDSTINQTGERNRAGVTQVGGQNSTVIQNGNQVSGVTSASAEGCGCKLVHCDTANANLDPACRQATSDKVIGL